MPIAIDSGPYNSPLSMIVNGNGAEVVPAEIVTVAGTVTRPGSLEVTSTTRSLDNAAGMVSVALTVPAPTVTSVGRTGVTGGRLATSNVLLSPV